MKPIIAPSILSADFAYLAKDLEMLNRSEFRYDGDEMEAYIRKMKAEYAAQGPEDGIPPMSDEELRQSVILQTEQGWLMEAFCRERGIASLTVTCAPCDEAMYRRLGFDTPLGGTLAALL